MNIFYECSNSQSEEGDRIEGACGCNPDELLAEIKRLQAQADTQKDRRTDLQGMVYAGMNLVDKILNKDIIAGEGVTESSFFADVAKAHEEIKRKEP